MRDHMFELLPASIDPGFHATGVDELFEHLARYRRNENMSACAQVLAAAAIWYERLREEAAIVDAGGRVAVGNSVYAEIGAALGCSATLAHTMVEIGTVLETKFPMILDSFDTGILDYQRVRVVVAVLGQASDDTLAMIETDVHSAAIHLTPGPLRAELWRLWTLVAPTEARAAKERTATEKRTAYVKRGPDGLSWLTAAVTDIEGAEADRLLDDIAATVCTDDPRTRNVLRADGLMALLHGESFLTCRCGASQCPNAVPAAPRRGYLTQILVDIRTLLGLANNPAHLGDGTPIDPDLALAEDSQWQAILTELRTTLDHDDDAPHPTQTATRAATDEAAETTGPEHHSATATTAIDTPDTAGPRREPARQITHAWSHATGRTRVRAGGMVRFAAPDLTPPATPGVGAVIDAWLSTITANPNLRTGIDPTGHGGNHTPPAGALTYRPSAALADLVRATHATCVFPGCSTPSTKCELEHRVPFDHDNPLTGGWTLAENLQPLCKRHHDIKSRRLWTCVPLGGGVILWTSPQHTHRITLPTLGTIGIQQPPEPTPPDEYELAPARGPGYTDDELLYEPTWWEEIIGLDEPAPTARELADEPYLRHRYNQHLAVTERRKQLQPAPF